MAERKPKAKLIETRREEGLAPGGGKRIRIVSCGGQSQVYESGKEARAAKAEIDHSSGPESSGR